MYGNHCTLPHVRWDCPIPHRWRNVSRRKIWNPTWKIARRHPYRRGAWLVLFPCHKFDLGFGDFDNYLESCLTVSKKITGGIMKKTICLLFLLLTACTAITSIPTATPTAIPPTFSPTIEPTPTLTSTPDAITRVLNDLQKDGINASHEDSLWILSFSGVEIPNAALNENGFTIQTKDGEINIPLSEMSERVENVEGSLVVKDSSGKALAGWNPTLTTENLAGKWFTESEAIGTPDSPIFIGDDIQDHRDYLKAEKLFLTPFPTDVYYPEQSKIVKNYYDSKATDPADDFSWQTPFGKLSPEDLDKSPFKTPANLKIIQGPHGFMLIISEQVYDPSDPKHIQELSLVDEMDYATLEEAQKAAKQYSYWQKNGYILLPLYGVMRTDALKKYPAWGKNLLYFLGELGYVDSAGNVETSRFWEMVVDEWLSSGRISPELEEAFILPCGLYIR